MLKIIRYNQMLAVVLTAALLLSGCSARTGGEPAPPAASQPAEPAREPAADPAPEPSPADMEPQQEAGSPYIEQVAEEIAAGLIFPDISEFEKAKAAFDYIIEKVTLDDPIGLDLWRVRENNYTLPSFVVNRSLSVLLHDVGMCEDYAAALTILLRGMGLEAEYVPGLTYAADGSGFVNHAWTVAKIDGVWYHLDSQLEQNVSRQGTIRYRFFMKSDTAFSASHLWGQRLIDSGRLTQAQNEELARDFLYEPCPQDYPTQPPRRFTSPPKPDMAALKAAAEAEIHRYEAENGPLPELELNIIPPVFALIGYPPS